MNLGRVGRIVAGLACTIIVLAAVGALTSAVLIPRVAGATPYAVQTGSMQPGLPPGSLAVVRPVEPGDVQVGTVVTYQLRSGDPTVATHRVVSIGIDAEGEYRFRTQGDANGAMDPEPVRPAQVKGALWYEVPYLGHVNEYVSGSQRQVVMIAVVSGLLLYAAYAFATAARDRFGRSRRRTSVGSS
jgi:signal peptidase